MIIRCLELGENCAFKGVHEVVLVEFVLIDVLFLLDGQKVLGCGLGRFGRCHGSLIRGTSRYDVDTLWHYQTLMSMLASSQCSGDGVGVRDTFPVGSADVLIGGCPLDRSQGGEWEEVRFEVRDLHGELLSEYEAAGLGQVFSCITNKKL